MLCDDLVAGGAPASGCDTADRVRHGCPRAAEAGRRHYAMRHVLADPQARVS
jgi:hypothetical protein